MPDPIDLSAGLGALLGISFEEITADRAVARMPIRDVHLQPLGYLHGGASVALAETVASVAATSGLLPESVAFGLEINANHVRPKRDGILRAVASRLHAGRTTQVWDVRITDESDRLICVSRCTLAVVPAAPDGAA